MFLASCSETNWAKVAVIGEECLFVYEIIIRHSEASEVPCVPVIEVEVVLVHSSPLWFSVD